MPPGVQLCEACTVELAAEIMHVQENLASHNRQHPWDIIIATVVFGATSASLILVGGLDILTLESMVFRGVILGIPFAVVLWHWYGMMRETDPDYGQLWHTYWSAQVLTFLVGMTFPLLVVTVYFFTVVIPQWIQ